MSLIKNELAGVIMKSGYGAARNLVWLTQLGISVVAPLLICILLSVWLSNHFGIGKWIVIIGVVLGVGGAISGLVSSLKALDKAANAEDDKKKQPVYFNEHK